jgi:peptidoglycan/LPS O-acetylase OafA/YrhL
VAIAEFILGSLVAIDVMAGTWPRFRWSVGWLFGLAAFLTGPIAYLIAGSRLVNLTNIALPLIPLMFFIAAAAHADIDRRGTIFSRRLAVRLGQVSYCFYLFHQLVIEAVAKALRGLSDVPLIILLFVASLAVAWLVHVIVEQPCERWLRGSSRPTPPVTVQS